MWKLLFFNSKNTFFYTENNIYLAPKPSQMQNYYSSEISPVGKKHVETWLTENGYFNIRHEPFKSSDYGFIAQGRIEGVIVQVRTFLFPQRPFKLSDFEIAALVGKATKLNLVAYAAYVTVDDEHNLARDILWERLS